MVPVYHPNIDMYGNICLAILHDNWSPALNIRFTLKAVQALMAEAEVFDSIADDVAAVYKSNRALFEKTAREWTASTYR